MDNPGKKCREIAITAMVTMVLRQVGSMLHSPYVFKEGDIFCLPGDVLPVIPAPRMDDDFNGRREQALTHRENMHLEVNKRLAEYGLCLDWAHQLSHHVKVIRAEEPGKDATEVQS